MERRPQIRPVETAVFYAMDLLVLCGFRCDDPWGTPQPSTGLLRATQRLLFLAARREIESGERGFSAPETLTSQAGDMDETAGRLPADLTCPYCGEPVSGPAMADGYWCDLHGRVQS